MFRLIAVTLAALYVVLYVFGDPARRPAEVSRAEPPGLSLTDFAALPAIAERTPVLAVSDVSEAEAIRIALEAGARARAGQTPDRLGARAGETGAATESAATAGDAPEYRYVTGSLVNLRGGPGTSNPVVGQVSRGAQAEVIENRDGWYRIRLAGDGATSGWIYGKFLGERRPG